MSAQAGTQPETVTTRIPIWVDLRHVPVNKRLGLLHAVDEMAAEHVLLAKGDPHTDRPGLRAVVVDGHNRIRDGAKVVGRLVRVKDARSQARAAAADGIVVVEADDWRVIPLENLVAARQGRGALFALARTPEEAALFAQALERGVDGVLLAARSPADLFLADRLLRALPQPPSAMATRAALSAPAPSDPLALVAAKVTRVGDGGFGDRVCVDCTSMFRPGEGLLVGSTARSFALVHAETPTSGFVAPRPFRVNAGAVHSYVLGPDGRTRYLSELRAGDEVLAVDGQGRTRTLTIGRCKVERRPHTLVHWQASPGEASAVLQTAETIRLFRPDGSLVAMTELKAGDDILVHHEAAARHVGMPISESLEER
ncbi:MAG: 3-dehydroquinate synthase II [Thermoplasmatota archaeon]